MTTILYLRPAAGHFPGHSKGVWHVVSYVILNI